MIIKINLILIFVFYYIFSIYGGNLIFDESKRASLFFVLLVFLIILNITSLKIPIKISSLRFYYNNFSLFVYALIMGIISSLLNQLNPIDFLKIILQYFIILLHGLSFFLICLQYKIRSNKFFSYLLHFSSLIIVLSFLLYFVDIYYEFDTRFIVTAFHLKNIFGLPALEGIFNPVNTIFFAALTLFIIITKPNIVLNLYNQILIAICLATIFLSTKRSGMLYLFELFLFILIVRNNIRFKYLIFFIVSFLLLIFLVNFDYLILGGSLENSFFDSRNHMFISLADLFYSSPFFGFGMGYHNFGYQKYSEFSSTDSTYVSFLIDTGIFGFFVFVMWVFRILYSTLKLSIKTSDYRFISILILYFSSALFSDIMNNPSSEFILFIVFFSFTLSISFLNIRK